MTSEQWVAVRRLLDEALDSPEQRPTLLAELRLRDPEICDELERLLNELDQGLDEEPDPSPAVPEIAGQTLGRYTIVGEIGRGGSGVVYRAFRQEADSRLDVAVKVLRKDYLCGARSMFRRELRALARLNHPNIARLIDWGTVQDGLVYLVIEYVDGVDIGTFCAQNHLALSDRLKLFQKVCAAVEHAHRNLIVHRDLKPSNILVADNAAVKLLDFGIAGELDSSDPTTLLQRSLTPAYASPEQLEGKPLTVASDVYSLGLVLSELLTGRLPHSEDPDSAPPVPSRNAALLEVPSRELAGDLDSILGKALQRVAEDRYMSVEQFSADIQRHLDGLPVLARRPLPFYICGRFLRRNRINVAAGALAAVALMATAGVAIAKWRAADRNLAEAQRDYRELRAFAQAVLSNIDARTLASPIEAQRRMSETVSNYLDQLRLGRQNDRELQLQLASAYLQLGKAQGADASANQGNTKVALQNFQKAYGIAAEQWRANHDRDSGLRVLDACQALAPLLDSPADGAAFLSRGIENTVLLVSQYPEDPGVLAALAGVYGIRGQRLRLAGDLATSIADFRHAVDLSGAVLTIQPSNRDALTLKEAFMGELGTDLRLAGRLDEALVQQNAAREIAVRAFLANPANHTRRQAAFKLLSRCETLRSLKKYPEARRDAAEALIELQALARNDPADEQAKADLSLAYFRLGDIEASQGQIQEALRNLREALRLREELSHRHPLNLQSARNAQISFTRVGEILLESRQFGASETIFDTAISTGRRVHEQSLSDVYAAADLARAYSGKASCAVHDKRWAAGLELLKQSVQLWREVRVACPLDVELAQSAHITEMQLSQMSSPTTRLLIARGEAYASHR